MSMPEGELRKALACGLNPITKRLKSFAVNGNKFQTIHREQTQNSGVIVDANRQAYYGRLTDIYQLDYYGSSKVVVFHCNWVDINSGLKTFRNGHACINFSKPMHTGRYLHDDPFVFHLKQTKFSMLRMRNKRDGYALLKQRLETYLI